MYVCAYKCVKNDLYKYLRNYSSSEFACFHSVYKTVLVFLIFIDPSNSSFEVAKAIRSPGQLFQPTTHLARRSYLIILINVRQAKIRSGLNEFLFLPYYNHCIVSSKRPGSDVITDHAYETFKTQKPIVSHSIQAFFPVTSYNFLLISVLAFQCKQPAALRYT